MIKKEITKNPNSSLITFGKKIFEENKDNLSYFSKTNEINQIFCSVKNEIKITDLMMIKTCKTKENLQFFRNMSSFQTLD